MRSPVEAQMDATAAVVTDAAEDRRLRTAAVTGLGVALPPDAVPSDAIGARLGLAPGWIERRTGIESRRRARSDLRLADLAADAASAALEDAGVDAGQVDTVIVATLSADEVTPNAAPQVAHAIGATGAGAFDVG